MTRWYAGSDHAGFKLKGELVKALTALGDEVVDVGAFDATTSVDYPDFARAACDKLLADPGALGLLVCGSGTGISIAANKVAGIRAVRATDPWSARMAREHNDANVVCFGERLIGYEVAREALDAFVDATFAGGRHQPRVAKIDALLR